jgi:RluA family pseudouridine synthase
MARKPPQVSFTVDDVDGETRLDKLLREKFPRWGRQAIGKLISSRGVSVNGKTVWLASWKVSDGDRIEIANPPADKPNAPTVFHDDWLVSQETNLIVVNKPSGLRSQATRAGGGDNLLSLAKNRFGEVRLFHRLDRDTSGLCLLTFPGPVNAYLDMAFKRRLVEKEYLAVVGSMGKLEKEGVISTPLMRHTRRSDMMQIATRADRKGVQSAETHYVVKGQVKGGWLVGLRPATGRMHQLRVHLASMGAPILGDRLYGGGEARRLMLHANRLSLPEHGEFPKRVYEANPKDFD